MHLPTHLIIFMRKRLTMAVILITCLTFTSSAQTAKFKALFLYNFAQNIGWPEGNSHGDFIITIIGEPEVASELKELSKIRKIGNSTLIIKDLPAVENIENTNIIFLGSSRSNQLSTLVASQKGKPVLIVGDQQGLCKQGAGITFMLVENKLRFEIDPSIIESHGLICSRRLVSLGTEIK
jgi:hypothetical protein